MKAKIKSQKAWDYTTRTWKEWHEIYKPIVIDGERWWLDSGLKPKTLWEWDGEMYIMSKVPYYYVVSKGWVREDKFTYAQEKTPTQVDPEWGPECP